MKLAPLVAQHITELFEGGNWTEVNLKDTLADVTHKEAATVTRASYNTIAALVHHLTFYNQVVLGRLKGDNPVIGETNGFDVPTIKTEADWQALKHSCMQSARDLAAAVLTLTNEQMLGLTVTGHATHYKTLHGISEHAHYHLGQVILLKNLLRHKQHPAPRSNSL